MRVLLVLLLALAAQAPASKEVPVSQEPSHHLVFENQYTRVYQVEVPAGRPTLLHRHDNDYVFVVLGDAHISNEVAGRPPLVQKLKDGAVNFAAGGFAHIARNLDTVPFRNVTIEILRKSTRRICGPGTDAVCPGGADAIDHRSLRTWNTVLETDAVKVTREEISPGGLYTKHLHNRDYLMVALSGLHLKNDVTGKGSATIQQKPGDVAWIQGGLEHTVTNLGKEPARFLVVEFR